MKERGLGTPATRADTIDGLINQKYIDRNQRELDPDREGGTAAAVSRGRESDRHHEPRDDRRVGTSSCARWSRGNSHGERFMAEIVEETKGIVERVKGFRGRRFGRARDRYDFTDRWQAAARNVARLQIAGRRVHDLQGHRRPQNGGSGDSRAGRDGIGRTARWICFREDARRFRGQTQTRERREDREMESRIRFRRQGRSRFDGTVLD